MRSARIGNSMVVAVCLASFVAAQDQAETCYGTGSVVGAVVGTLIVTLGLLVSGFLLYKMYWKNRKGKHLVLMTDAENPLDQYAFDNPCFREATPFKHTIQDEKASTKLEKNKWPGWPPVHTFGKEQRTEKITSMDDTYLNDSRLKIVTLKSHDFTGLGFNICGNMRDGIFVKDVLHRGPAFESGCINTGDRIDSVCISFRNMVFEDALTILSYASPYDVQVQVENDSCSRPSTLMRSKRESNAVSSSDRILHPKFNRSQSISHLSEFQIGKTSNKKLSHQTGFTLEKNRINRSLNKFHDLSEPPNNKVSSAFSEDSTAKNVTSKISPLVGSKKSPKADNSQKEFEYQHAKLSDPQNKLQKFGIKVLPMSINPKMGIQSVTGVKKSSKSATHFENEVNLTKERSEKIAKFKELSCSFPPVEEHIPVIDQSDASKDNVKTMLTKGFLNIKEKINQNTSGKKRKEESEDETERGGDDESEGNKPVNGSDYPVPKLRSSLSLAMKEPTHEQNQQNNINVPEEVSRAGDVARNNRKSAVEARKSITNLEYEEVGLANKAEQASDSEESSDRESVRGEAKRPKRSKGKAPAPPKQVMTSKEIDEIKKESEIIEQEGSIFEPDVKTMLLKNEGKTEKSSHPSYHSDSDTDSTPTTRDIPNMKIELNATQVTVHQSSSGDANDDDVEPSRKAASMGDLSKLDSDQPLSVVLERAVSLDLTEGTSQCGKKRKAPLPPSEEFPVVFVDLSYRKESRLEGLNTFQRRLKKSSDFGTLEDAFCSGPKSLEMEGNKTLPYDLMETHNNNIQEFSSWLAECRRPKIRDLEAKKKEDKPIMNSTSLVNINSSECLEKKDEALGTSEYQGGNISLSVNRENFKNFEASSSSENSNFPETNSCTVVVISQPNSLEPTTILEAVPACGEAPEDAKNGSSQADESSETREEEDTMPPKLPSSPMPSLNTLSSPLSSTLTYITEIKVSTSVEEPRRSEAENLEIFTPKSITERIQKFDSPKGFAAPQFKNNLSEMSKVPFRTMKSETGQKVLATIHSLAKESFPTKTPELEYTKRMATLLSTSQKNDSNIPIESEILTPNVSGSYLKTAPQKPSKDHSPTRKVPPVVPPRKMETSLTSKSTITVELPLPPDESREKNIVTFSSFTGRNQNKELSTSSKISFKIKEHGEINGREESAEPTKIVFETKEA